MTSSLQPSPTILLPHLPPKTLVGIDLITFTSTANFHGIRDLPKGWHFLYTGTTESLSLRCGAWFYVGDISTAGHGQDDSALVKREQTTGPDIYIWKWKSDTESLSSLRQSSDSDRQDAMRFKANLGAIWQSGGLFRYRSRVSPAMLSNKGGSSQSPAQAEDDDETEESGRKDWRQLTDWLSPSLLNRIIGDPEMDVDSHPRWHLTSAGTADRDADHIPGLDKPTEESKENVERPEDEEKEFGFLPVDLKQTWREGAIGRERTEAAQDRSWALGDLILRNSSSVSGEVTVDERTGETQVLGELQFTFLMVVTMMNFSCLQQWKRLLELILTCRQAILDRETFMSDVVRLLLWQLQRSDDVEGGLFEIDGDGGGAFLLRLLKKLKLSVDQVVENGAESKVKTELERLGAWVKEEYDWELDHETVLKRGTIQLEDGEEIEMEMDDNDEYEETGEYAPVIVDLDDDSAKHDAADDDGEMSDLEDMRY
ncbi:hypothetical protein PENSTE_c001G01123 [Penicillium steckii]|uniref:Uncharacterized protein n=1 Tax=Penicillium steckii TaxID=303698 RepID=A0A1V6U174_9EURO|nr:hypothetical protein PENSTE_c001G01123 [Penicillium steckii]